MDTKHLDVVGVDWLALHEFVVYFSDDTLAKVNAEELAACFPDREHVPPPED